MADPRTALVTGGSGTIGGACVRALAGAGWSVAIGYRQGADEAKALAAEVEHAIPVQLDVGDSADVGRAFAEVEAELGPVGVLVNVAGRRRDQLAMRVRDADWDEALRVNLTGSFYCARRALPNMLAARWGRIVNIGSAAGIVGSPGQTAYAAAKAGLVGLTKSLSREVAAKGVTTNLVSPGFVDSAMTGDLDAARREHLRSLTATGRDVAQDDVARAVLYCVETASVTGQVLNVDGGLT